MSYLQIAKPRVTIQGTLLILVVLIVDIIPTCVVIVCRLDADVAEICEFRRIYCLKNRAIVQSNNLAFQ